MRRVIEVDLVAVFLAMKYQLPVMERQGRGAILNVASAAGVTGRSAHVGLCSREARRRWPDEERCRRVRPQGHPHQRHLSVIRRHAHGDRHARPDARWRTGSQGAPPERRPMRRIAEPEEIVQAMLWICSPQNSFMTGHSLVLDGGLTAL
jgi:NAD(P)-dependent dehydrogenase (short-subunit alcohol dehydrogenase family)